MASGGPLDVAGYESALVSASEFKSCSKELLQDLHLELENWSDASDIEIGVDDLKIASANDFIERGIQEARQIVEKVETPEKKRKRKRKQGTGKKKGRPCDRETRAAELEQENEFLTKLVEDRRISKENALATLQSLRGKEETEEKEKNLTKRLRSAGPLKFVTSVNEAPNASSPSDGSATPSPPAAIDDVVISIDFHSSNNTKVQEFLVLGSQPLTALRDQLYCLTDQLACQKNMVVPSGYFLIENVFYNDMRHLEAVDYSELIRNWLTNNETRKGRRKKRFAMLSNAKSVSMAETRFQDLEFKLGSQYLYCHQGDCKHFLVFRDIRLAHPDDVQNPAEYPLLRFVPRLRFKKCSICSMYRARKVTYDDKLAPSNPCFFCERCYDSLHYSSEGALLYEDFRVHEYFHE